MTETPRTAAAGPNTTDRFELVALDLYRDIHKGIRTRLFAVTEAAGRVDPSDAADRAALRDQVEALAAVLDAHAGHEDTAVLPALEVHLPALAARNVAEHEMLEPRIHELAALAGDFAAVPAADARRLGHELYLGLASFTAAYLEHQRFEERVVGPALEDAIGLEAVLAIHEAIVSSIPPQDMAESLAFMLPAMNVDDRAELLGGMRAGAPAAVFQGILALAGTVLPPAEQVKLLARLGV